MNSSERKEPLRKRKLKRHGDLLLERGPWEPRWRQLSQFILPFSSRFNQQRTAGGNAIATFNAIYDSTATRAHRVLSAGLMAGMTSPARPWFRLATPDPDLMEHEPVKLWLDKVARIMRDVFARSNTYRAFHTQYDELGCFATAANLIVDNFDSVLWNHPLTAGEYCIAVDHLGRPNTLYREMELTVAQLVEEFIYDKAEKKFDWSKASHHVKNMWDTSKLDQWIPILHTIEPRLPEEREYGKRDGKNKPVASCYFEKNGDEEKVLRESGYDEFPGTISRWHTRGSDIYGHGPSFEALGDIKQLQQEQFRKGQAIDFMSKPPIELPPEAKGNEVEYLPGGVTIGGANAGQRGRNLIDVRVDLQHLLMDIKDVRERIEDTFYKPLFLAITNMEGVQPRNQYEIAERHEEKLLMLGPVLERLHDELLGTHIDISFAKVVNSGILRSLPPPPEMEGMDLKVEFVSTLAQAQKAVGLGSMDRLLGTVGMVAQGSQDPSVWDKIDRDQVIDKYSDMLAVDPSIIVSDDKIVFLRESRQRQAQAQQVGQMAQPAAQAAQAAKALGETDAENVRDVMSNLMGYGGSP